MQRRVSRIQTADVKPDLEDLKGYELTPAEKRKALGQKKQVLAQRAKELRTIIGVKQGVKASEIKGRKTKHPAYDEWVRVAKELFDIDQEIKKFPKKKPNNLNHYICQVVKESVSDQEWKEFFAKAEALKFEVES